MTSWRVKRVRAGDAVLLRRQLDTCITGLFILQWRGGSWGFASIRDASAMENGVRPQCHADASVDSAVPVIGTVQVPTPVLPGRLLRGPSTRSRRMPRISTVPSL